MVCNVSLVVGQSICHENYGRHTCKKYKNLKVRKDSSQYENFNYQTVVK